MSTPAVDDLTVVAVVGGSVVDGSENHYNNADTLLIHHQIAIKYRMFRYLRPPFHFLDFQKTFDYVENLGQLSVTTNMTCQEFMCVTISKMYTVQGVSIT